MMDEAPLDRPVLLELENLTKVFALRQRSMGLGFRSSEVAAVTDVSLSLPEGTTVGLVGESGSGKSTIARVLLGLEEPSDGSVKYMGRDLKRLTKSELADFRRNVQMVFQDPYGSINPTMSVGEVVGEGWKIHRGLVAPDEWDHRLDRALMEVGLKAELRGAKSTRLSGGQRQRVGIARALALGPRYIVCDEPTSALDVSIQAQVLNLLLDLQSANGFGMLFVSHDLAVVRYMADSVVVLFRGEVVESGPAASLFSEPRHPYTERLLAATPLLGERNLLSHRSLEPLDEAVESSDTTGCAYKQRCPYAREICSSVAPTLTGDAHKWACHYPITR